MFSLIQSEEFLNRNWEVAKFKHRASNIIRLIEHTNNFSLWIASLIVSGKTTRDRKHRIKQCLRLAEVLKSLNNFNSLFAVLNALNNPSVTRLKHTFALFKDLELKQYHNNISFLENNTDNLNNKRYRDLFKTIKKSTPCIPHL
jgi:son of sevenless